MDRQLQQKIRVMSSELARDEKQKLDAAGTFVDLERLTMEIGDELTRQLTCLLLADRAEQTAATPEHACPDCGKLCQVEAEREPLILQGMRGEIEYQEPRCHCSRCRGVFLPRAETCSS
jgi:Zn finger protein HypA/HybF involved in hydrogenase expression